MKITPEEKYALMDLSNQIGAILKKYANMIPPEKEVVEANVLQKKLHNAISKIDC